MWYAQCLTWGIRGPDPGGHYRMVPTVNYITGGTGKLAGIQGTVQTTGSADPKAGVNETEVEIGK